MNLKQHPLVTVNKSDNLMQIILLIHKLNGIQCRSWSKDFFWSHYDLELLWFSKTWVSSRTEWKFIPFFPRVHHHHHSLYFLDSKDGTSLLFPLGYRELSDEHHTLCLWQCLLSHPSFCCKILHNIIIPHNYKFPYTIPRGIKVTFSAIILR